MMLRCRLALSVAFVFGAMCASTTTLPDQIPRVWVATHNSIFNFDPAANTVSDAYPVSSEIEGLAVDPRDGAVWVLSHKRLMKHTHHGAVQLQLDLDRIDPGFDEANRIRLNPYHGGIWVAGHQRLLYLSDRGVKRATWSAPQPIVAIAIDIDETVWVLTRNQLFHLADDGRVRATVDIASHTKQPEALIVDGLGGLAWVIDTHALLRFDTNRLAQAPMRITLPTPGAHRPIGTSHPVFGTLWLATQNTLTLYDRSGALIRQVDIAAHGDIEAIEFEPISASLWLAGKKAVARYTGNGDFVSRTETQKEIEAIAAGPFTLVPRLALDAPSDGSVTNNPAPAFEYALSAQCSGIPCLLVDSYISSLSLDVSLDGQAIGPLFQRHGARAFYAPATRLGEGTHTLRASATDVFGHASAEVVSRFSIDTIAPKFISISPADGTVVNQPAVTIAGQVDDPTASVILADANGQGISMGGANFSFAVTLKNGLNLFQLTARDAAGNETTVPLRLTLAGGLTVTIQSPTPGANLNSTNVVVRGMFSGPANTGITINGTPAALRGSAFYANLALPPGQNTILAQAATASGGTATHSVNVVVQESSVNDVQVTVDPQSGIAPHAVRFSVSTIAPQPIARIDVDFNGDGTTDFSTTDSAIPIAYTYNDAGVYTANVTVTDQFDVSRSFSFYIVVTNLATIDGVLRGVYDEMLAALRAGNIDGALTAVSAGMRDKYRTIFQALGTILPTVVDQLGALQTGAVGGDMAEYVVVRDQNGQPAAFLIYFMRGEDGVWRIDGM